MFMFGGVKNTNIDTSIVRKVTNTSIYDILDLGSALGRKSSLIAISTYDYYVKIFDTKSGKLIKTFNLNEIN